MKTNTKRIIKRIICFVVMVSILSQSSVQTALAWSDTSSLTEQETESAAVETQTGTAETTATEEETTVEPEILEEIEENRGEFSKEYLLSDNSHAVVVYPEQIHYENEEGVLEEIDNSLVKTDEGYANANNSYDVLITDNEDSQGEVIYKENDYEIAWQMVEVETVTEEVETETETETVTEDETETETETSEADTEVLIEEIAAPELDAEVEDCEPETEVFEDEEIHQVKQSKITFDGYKDGVSVEYEPTGDGIKENIILPTRESGNEYVFSIQLKGLKARLNSANEIEFYDEKTDEIQYYFPAPFMIDSEGDISYAAKYKLIGVEEEEWEEEAETEEEETVTEETETEESETEEYTETEELTETEETENEETSEEEMETQSETESESESDEEAETGSEQESESEPDSEPEEGSEEAESVEDSEPVSGEEKTEGQAMAVLSNADAELTADAASAHANSIQTLSTETPEVTKAEESGSIDTSDIQESEEESEPEDSAEEPQSETETQGETTEAGSEDVDAGPDESEPESTEKPESESETTENVTSETEPTESETTEPKPTQSEEPDTTEPETEAPAPADPETSENATATIEEIDLITSEDDNVYIKIVLDEEWLDQASYPVTVDPVLKQARTKNLLDYGSVCSNGDKKDTLYVGKNKNGIYRSYVRFDLPEMEKQSIVSEAMLYLNGTINYENKHYLTASTVTEEWYNKAEEQKGKELTWDTQPGTGDLLDYHINAGRFNITKAVRKWMSGEQENYGIVFKAYDETKSGRDTIKLKNSASSPYLKITYRSAVGLESYWGTHATGAGTAGAGYINDYTGALTVVNTDVVTAGNRFPMSIGHVYNSNDTDKNAGWQLNYGQTIRIPSDTADIKTYPYVYTDEDGTPHYFKKGDVTYLENGASKEVKGSASIPSAKDEDGLKLFIVPVNDKTLKETYPLKLIDKSSSIVRYFDKMGRLGMITDSNQYENGKNSDKKEKNAITIHYESYGSEVPLTAFENAIASATALKELCSVNTTKTDSEEYIAARDQLKADIDILKKDTYTTADYTTAKQINAAALKMADLTDTTSSVSRGTAKTKAGEILTVVQKAKTAAEKLTAESSKRIAKVTDAVGNEAVFTYDENGNIKTISDPTYGDGKVNTYSYDSEGNLTQITFADGKKAYYTYGDDNLLLSQRDHDGYQVVYTYREPDKRIVKVEESHSGTPGQTYSIQYNTDNTTTFRFSGVDDAYGTSDDIENVHVFDEQGRAVCVYSNKTGEKKVLGATACTYESTANSDGSENTNKRNKIKDTAVVGMHTNNLLKNHSFEYNDKTWTTYKNVDETPESGALSASSTTRKYLGDRAAYVNLAKRKGGTAGFKQEAKLTKGTYTFSGYCRSTKMEKASAYLKVTDADGNSYYSNKVTEATSAAFDNGWQRLEVTFSIPTDQNVIVYLETDCGTETGVGNAAFDCVQLEAGNVANDYNILEDGSFELTEETLPYKAKKFTASKVAVEDAREEGGVDGAYCYHITGQPGKDKFLRFSTKLGSAKNSFVLSGWFKTDSTPVRKNRDIKVVAYHTEETDGVTTTLRIANDINAYSEGWKYFTMIIPAASWKDTTFTIRFYDNIGDLYIDGLQLTRNDVQTKKYDSEGHVTTKYTALKSSSATYDSYNRTKTQTTAAGAKNTYTYSKTNDTTKIAASIGPDTYMTYDQYGNQLSSSSYDPDAEKKLEMYSETSYTEDGNFQKTSTDNAGNVTSYEYNTLTGQLEKTILPQRSGEEAVEVDYIYDEQDRIKAVAQGGRTVGYEYGEFDDLTAITHNGFSYNYTYDKFGNVVDSSIAGTTICTNHYAENNGSHVKSVYPDGTETGTTYDEYGKVTSNSLNDITITKYVYDNDGNVAKKTDALAGVTTKYDYNDSNMLVRSEVYDGETTASEALESRMQYTYTKSGQVGTLSYQEKDDDIRTYTYTYAKDQKPVKSTLPDLSYTSWAYDSLRRNTKIVHTPKSGASDGKKLYTVLEYKEAEFTTADEKTKKSKTGLVQHYVNKFGSSGDKVSEFRYTYDEWGNITFINDIVVNGEEGYYAFIGELDNVAPALETGDAPDVTTFSNDDGTVSSATGVWKESSLLKYGRRYTYNDLGEVVTASETYSDKTTTKYAYSYDEGGNILTETIDGTVHTYAYDDTWKDKLVSYDGKTITYDVFGCPLDYMGTAMTWDIYGGLTSVDNGTDSITYTYMGDGQRRSKTVNGVTTTYHYNNGMLLSETTGDETLRYYYDSTGKVASIVYKKGDGEETGYFYARNAQGDIIAVYRSTDSKLMGTYEYDLWGRPISSTATEDDIDNITNKNPYRYRGYYYDKETGFYYLTARYYDPEIRRFISADSLCVLMVATIDVACKNLFAYAENNPVTQKDSSGEYVESAFDIVTLVTSVGEVFANPTDIGAWVNAGADIVDVLGPGVTGIGEAVRGLRAGDKAIETGEKVSDAVKIANRGKTFDSKIDIPVNEKGYTKSSLELGKKVHNEYKADQVDNISKFKEYVLPSGKRVDYIDFNTKTVYELKPNNPNQINKGIKQLAGYVEEIENNSDRFGYGWTSILDTY